MATAGTGATMSEQTSPTKDRHEQQEPLGVAHPTAVAANGDGLEETDQIIDISLIDCGI
jgi:hypothetical protein